MKKHIKTVCGLKKYEELVERKGIFNKLRFYWFVFFAVIYDFAKKNEMKEEKTRKTSSSP